MRKLFGCFVVVLILAALSTSVLAESMLSISDVIAKVDGDKQSADETGGVIKVTPDSELSLKVKVENMFPDGIEDGKIENIEVSAVLEGIDDGDDIEVDLDSDFSLSTESDKTVTLNFEIPLRLETDDTFTLTLTAEGEDENSTDHSAEVQFDVDVDKENHEIRVLRKELNPPTVSCNRQSTLLLRFINTGEEDETVELTVDAVGFNFHKTASFDLVEDVNDDQNEYELSDVLSLDNSVVPGSYPIMIKALYRDGRQTLQDQVNLVVEKCSTAQTTPVETPEEEEEIVEPVQPKPVVKEEVSVVTQPQETYVKPASTAVATPKTSYTKKSWLDQNQWLLVILLTDIVLVIAGIIVVVAVLKRRR